MSWLLDTSIFIGEEQGRLRGEIDDEVAVSVITLAELEAGVLAAAEPSIRARRLRTLEQARRLALPLPVDESVASAFALLRVELAQSGRRMRLNDAWIAATALANGLGVCTQDADFDDVPGLNVLRV